MRLRPHPVAGMASESESGRLKTASCLVMDCKLMGSCDPVKTGSLYPAGKLGKYRDKITVLNTAPHQPDEWFTQEVMADGNRITIQVNGKITTDFRDPEKSFKKGHFALQAHDPGSVMKFRKIQVKELPARQ